MADMIRSKEFEMEHIHFPSSICLAANADSALDAARKRLAYNAENYRRCRPLTSGEYYGGGRKEEAVPSCSKLAGMVTRNHYGCLVLNAAHALFIDVDVLAPDQLAVDAIGSYDPTWQGMFDDLRTVLAAEAGESFRIYRTAAGFRVLATAKEYDPESTHSAELMRAAGADSDFVDLCRIQNSFRARLSPKPWRCGVRRPPNLFPRHTEGELCRFAEWLSGYERASANRATCHYLGGVGSERIHPRIGPVIELHDRETRAHEALALA
jgi:hypothetical protein